jgi:hypothetical protein
MIQLIPNPFRACRENLRRIVEAEREVLWRSSPSLPPLSKAALCISIIMFVMFGCTTRPSMVATVPESLPINCESANSTERLIVSNRQMSLTVVDIEVAIEKVQKTITEFGGYIDQEQTQVYHSKEANFTVRLPKDSLSEASEKIKTIAERINNEWAIGQDITEQYADLEVQLCELEQEGTALQERIAYNPADQLSDQLADLENEIELVRGKIVYRNERLSLASLTLYLSVE